MPAQPLHQLCAMTQGQLGGVLVREIDRLCGAGIGRGASSPMSGSTLPTRRSTTRPSRSGRSSARERAGRAGSPTGLAGRRGRRARATAGWSPRLSRSTSWRWRRSALLLDAGHVVLAAGGGGVAVSRAADGALTGVDAVIDKDHAAAALATAIGASELFLAHRRRCRPARLRHARRAPRPRPVRRRGRAAPGGRDSSRPGAWVPRSPRRCASCATGASGRSSPPPIAWPLWRAVRRVSGRASSRSTRGSGECPVTASGVRSAPGAYLDSLLLMSATVDDGRVRRGGVGRRSHGHPARVWRSSHCGGFAGERAERGQRERPGARRPCRRRARRRGRAGRRAGRQPSRSASRHATQDAAEQAPASLAEAAPANPDVNVAIVSVPGEYAALEAHHALTAGLHVLLFSDGVAARGGDRAQGPRSRARAAGDGPGRRDRRPGRHRAGLRQRVGRLACGRDRQRSGSWRRRAPARRRSPPCSTGGAWASRRSSASAAATCREQVGGRMARLAVRTLDDDPGTGAVLRGLQATVADDRGQQVLDAMQDDPRRRRLPRTVGPRRPRGVQLRAHAGAGCARRARLVGRPRRDPRPGCARRSLRRRPGWPPVAATVRGLFSGGTLCYEAQLILEDLLGRGLLQRAAASAARPARARRCPRTARPGGGGVHARRAAPDDRPERPAGAVARAGERPRRSRRAARRGPRSRQPRRPRRSSWRRSAPS